MLTKIDVRTSQGTVLTLELDDVSDGLILADVDGLDPVKATLVSSSYAKKNGKRFQSARREERNLTMRIELDPDLVEYTVKELRDRLYDFFMPTSEVVLTIYDSSGLEVDITGRVETCETKLFAKDPVADIVIVCFESDFVNMTPVELTGDTVSDSTDTPITYIGNVETGIVLTLNVDRNLAEFTIYHLPPTGILATFDFAAELLADDILTISTVPGDKYITLNRGGTLSSLLRGMSSQSAWISLVKGINNFRVYAVGDPIPYEISYMTRYGGL